MQSSTNLVDSVFPPTSNKAKMKVLGSWKEVIIVKAVTLGQDWQLYIIKRGDII